MVDLAYAYVPIVPSLKGAQSTIQKDLSSINLGKVGNDLGNQISKSFTASAAVKKMTGEFQAGFNTVLKDNSKFTAAAGSEYEQMGRYARIAVGDISSTLKNLSAATGKSFSSVSQSASTAWGAIPELASAAASKTIGAFNSAAGNISYVFEPITTAAKQTWGYVVSGAKSAGQGAKSALSQVSVGMTEWLSPVSETAMRTWRVISSGARDAASYTVDALGQVKTGLVEWVTPLGQAAVKAWQGFTVPAINAWDGLKSGARNAYDNVVSVFSRIGSTAISWFTPVVRFSSQAWTSVSNAAIQSFNSVRSVGSQIGAGVSQWFAPIASKASTVFAPLRESASRAFGVVSSTASSVASSTASVFSGLGSRVSGVFGGIGGSVGKAFSSVTKQASGMFGNFKAGWQDAELAQSSLTGRLGTFGGAARSAFNIATSAAASAGSGIKSAFSTAFDGVRGLASDTGTFISSTLKTSAGVAATGITAVLGTSLVGGFQRLATIENAEAKMRGLGLSTEVVTQAMQQANEAATGTAFTLGDMGTTAASALTAGIQPGEELNKYLGSVKNAAAASGAQLSEIGNIFGKVISADKAYLADIQMIGDRGIPIWQKLSEQMGLSVDETMKQASKGAIDFQMFQTAVTAATGTMADEMGKTTTSAFTNMKASFSRFGEAILAAPWPVFTQLFNTINKGMGAAAAAVRPFADYFGERLNSVVIPALEKLQEKFTTIKDTFKNGFQLPDMSGFGATLAALAPVLGLAVGALAPLLKNLPFIGSAFAGLNPIVGLTVGAFAGLVALSPGLQGALSFLAGGVFDAIIGLFQTLSTAIQPLLPQLQSVIQQIGAGLGAVLIAVTPILQQLVGFIGQLLIAVLPLVPAVLSLIPPFLQLLPPLLNIVNQVLPVLIQGLMQVVPPVVQLATAIISQLLPPVLGLIQPLLQLVSAVLPPLIGLFVAILPPILSLASTIITALIPVIQSIITVLTGVINFVLGVFTGNWSLAWDGIKQIFSGIWGALSGIVTGAFTVIVAVVNAGYEILKAVWVTIWNWIGKFVTDTWTGFIGFIKDTWNGFATWIQSAGATLSTWWNDFWSGISKWVTDRFNDWKSGAKFIWDGFISWLTGATSWLGTTWNDFWTNTVNGFKNIWSGIQSGAKSVWDGFTKWWGDVSNNFQSGWESMWGNIGKFFSDTWDGLKEAAKEPVRFVVDTVINGFIGAWNGLAGPISDDLKIDPIKLDGFASGGWTGPGSKYTPAGLVHADEFVINKSSQRSIAAAAPGYLDSLNRHGAAALGGYAEGGLVKLKAPVSGVITSGWMDPARGTHVGVDWGANQGTPIHAPGDGTVTTSGWPFSWSGYTVIINHGDGIESWLQHMVSQPPVKVGAHVKTGDTVGFVGSTGDSTGPHLHYSIKKDGQYVDPSPYIEGGGAVGTGSGGLNPLGFITDLVGSWTGKFGEFANQNNMLFKFGKAKVADLFGALPEWAGGFVSSIGDGIGAAWSAITGGGGDTFSTLTADQKNIAKTITQVARSMGLGDEGAMVGLMTAMQESTLRNLNYGDRDSVGVFQQRPSQGWGSVAQIMDVSYAARKFFEGLKGVSGWRSMSPTLAADAVQRSAFPTAYAKWEGLAREILANGFFSGGLVPTLFDRGGVVDPGTHLIANKTRDPEYMFTSKNLADFTDHILEGRMSGDGAVFTGDIYANDPDELADVVAKKLRRARALSGGRR